MNTHTEAGDVTLKIAVLALALLAGWVMLFRPKPLGRMGPGRRDRTPRGGKPAARVTAFERCPRCEAYRLPGGPCACDQPPETAER